MRLVSLTLLLILALASVAGADMESKQKAVQPLWLRENAKGVLTGATDTTFALATDGLESLTFISDHACSIRVVGPTHAILGGHAWLLDAGTITLAVDDPESVKIWVGGPGDKKWSMLGSKR